MIKKRKDKTVVLRMSSDDFELFRIACKQYGVNPSYVLRKYIENYVRAYKLSTIVKPINISRD